MKSGTSHEGKGQDKYSQSLKIALDLIIDYILGASGGASGKAECLGVVNSSIDNSEYPKTDNN